MARGAERRIQFPLISMMYVRLFAFGLLQFVFILRCLLFGLHLFVFVFACLSCLGLSLLLLYSVFVSCFPENWCWLCVFVLAAFIVCFGHVCHHLVVIFLFTCLSHFMVGLFGCMVWVFIHRRGGAKHDHAASRVLAMPVESPVSVPLHQCSTGAVPAYI